MSANLKLVKFHRSLYAIFLLQENCLYNISSVSKSYSTSRCINTQPSPRKINPKLTVPPFFLEFHSVFSPTCHKIREEMITKFTTFSFSIDFLGVFFFLIFTHLELPCRSLWLNKLDRQPQEELQQGGLVREGKYTKPGSSLT